MKNNSYDQNKCLPIKLTKSNFDWREQNRLDQCHYINKQKQKASGKSIPYKTDSLQPVELHDNIEPILS